MWVREVVSVIMGVIVGLTFLFGFGNVLSLGLRLGVSAWVAPLVAPAVDLSVLALLLAIRQLALCGASAEELRPAGRLLMFSSLVTLALNVADPLLAAEWGKAAFDAVGPLLLIGWAHVGPGLLHALSRPLPLGPGSGVEIVGGRRNDRTPFDLVPRPASGAAGPGCADDVEGLLERAMVLDVEHRRAHQRPISAETLRRCLRIGASRSRALVAEIRLTYSDGLYAVR